MVTVRLVKLPLQVLSASPPTVAVQRQETEAATADTTGAGAIRMLKLPLQVLAKSPATMTVSRQETEAATVDSTGTGAIQLAKLPLQVLAKLPATVGVLRQETEAATSDSTTAAPVRLVKLPLQVLVKTPPAGPVPIPLPDELCIMMHNWASPFKLSSDYFTDIASARSTASQTRVGLRGKPGRTITISVLDRQEDLSLALTQLRRHTNERLPVPLSCDATPVAASASAQAFLACDPTNKRFFAGGRVAVVRTCFGRIVKPADRDIYRIQTVFPDSLQMTTNLLRSYDDSWDVVPLIDAEKALNTGTGFITDSVTEADLEFVEIVGPNLLNPTAATSPAPAGWPVHTDGLPIFETQAKGLLHWAPTALANYVRPGRVDLKGRKVRVSPDGPREAQVQTHNFLLRRADFWQVLRFWDSRMGALLPFWEVDLEHRWTVLTAAGVFIEIDPDQGDFDKSFKDPILAAGYLGIVMEGGVTVHIRKIATILETGGKWRCTLDGGEPALSGINLALIERCAPARIKQFDSDVLGESWITDDIVAADLTTEESLENEDIDL